ncbi:MAG: hypothetical protein QW304_09005 [Thermoproteota archaeon]
MVVKDVIEAVKMALENMDERYCIPSKRDYSEPEKEIVEKYLERPFAYEFYHQLRKLIDKGNVNLGEPIIQAEVDKRYQHLFKNGKIPDFIMHVPNTSQNLAVIEFKLAPNLSEIEDDLEKLAEFKRNDLRYTYLIEVVIGNRCSLERARENIRKLSKTQGEKITIIEFDTRSWKANESEITFKSV